MIAPKDLWAIDRRTDAKSSTALLVSLKAAYRLALIVAVGMLTLLPHAAQSGPVLDRVKSRGSVIIGHRESSVPFSYVDQTGEVWGYSIDLCLQLVRAIQARIGAQALAVEYRLVTTSTRMQAIESGSVDLECGSTTSSDERRKVAAFTIPIFVAGMKLLVPTASDKVQLHEFAGRRVVSTKSTTALNHLKRVNQDHLMGIEIIEADDHAAAARMVSQGIADAFLMDDAVLYGIREAPIYPGSPRWQ